MTIQERRNFIFHNYGTDVDTLDSSKLRGLIQELDYLADDLKEREAKITTIKQEIIRALSDIADKYRGTFSTIFLFDGNISLIDEEDIDFTLKE